MDKGIRQGVVQKFAEMLPLLATEPALKEHSGRKFRRAICDWAVETYGCTLPAAGSHYNYAFQEAKKVNRAALEGIGRAEGKNNGGRKKKVAVAVETAVVEDALTVGDVVDSEMLNQETEEDEGGDAPVEEPVKLVNVIKVKDGTIVCEGLTVEEAEKLIVQAKEKKKAALAIAE